MKKIIYVFLGIVVVASVLFMVREFYKNPLSATPEEQSESTPFNPLIPINHINPFNLTSETQNPVSDTPPEEEIVESDTPNEEA